MKEYLVYSCLIILVYCMTGINSQFGPPPLLTITGASQSQVRQPIQYTHRNERLVSSGAPNGGFLRSRRPVLATPPRQNTLQPFQTPNSLNEDPKPVTEENESAETPSFIPQQSYVPQIQQVQPLQHIQPQPQFKQPLPSVLYTTDENGEVLEHHRPLIDFSTTPRLLQQPNPAEIVPTTIRTTHNLGNGQRFFSNQDRPVQSALIGTTKPPLRARPEYREPRPQFEGKELSQPIRHVKTQQQIDFANVKPRPHQNHDDREKKPVAQILRKYREENEDGTITWGFENDDGSFKEEIIGNDCVTRGRYGYIDPDGVKREYNYETGILCDPNKRDLEEQEENEDPERGALQDNGAYIDYQENQMVLSSGQRINLSNIGKNKTKRPIYRNN